MPLTDQQKAKMAEGRRLGKERREAAALAAKAADATSIPAGHTRDEQIRVNADSLQAQREIRSEDLSVGSIDPAKLNAEPDNEAMRYAMEQRRIRFEHKSGVENARPGWMYARMKAPGTCGTEAAKSETRNTMTMAKREGWIPVQGDDPEDKKYEGNDCAAGTTMRGYMDTFLMKIRQEDYILMTEAQNDKQRRREGFDAETLAMAARTGQNHHAVAGDLRQDPFMARRVTLDRAVPYSTQVTTQFTEGDLRRGSIPGMPIGR